MGSAAASHGGSPIGVAVHMNPDHEQNTFCQTENESVSKPHDAPAAALVSSQGFVCLPPRGAQGWGFC